MILSEKGAMTSQRVEEQGRWRVAQGLLRKVEGKADAAARLMHVLAKTDGDVLSRLSRGGGQGRGGSGGVGQVVRWLGGPLTAPHMDPERVEAFFGDKHSFPGIEHLKHIARVGVPVDVLPGGDLAKELEYGNHSSANNFGEAVWKKAVADVACGRAIVFPKEQADQVPGLRVSPVGVVEEREKIRIIHDMTFEHRDGHGGGSVNATTDWDEIPACALAGVMREVLQRILGLRAKFGGRARILIQKMDVKNAFRQIPVDPDGAAAFGYVLGRYLFVDLRLQFGWRGSPGWWGVVSAAMQHAQRNTTRAAASFSQAGDRAVEHVRIAPCSGRPVVSWPAECVVRVAEGGGAYDPAFVVFFMDDAISVEVQWEEGGGGV